MAGTEFWIGFRPEDVEPAKKDRQALVAGIIDRIEDRPLGTGRPLVPMLNIV
jgi:hypothetical protein